MNIFSRSLRTFFIPAVSGQIKAAAMIFHLFSRLQFGSRSYQLKRKTDGKWLTFGLGGTEGFKNVLVVLAIIVGVAAPAVVSAQEEQTGGSGLSISPTRFELTIERGSAETAAIQVKNITDDDIIAKAYLNDFEPDGNTGNPKLIIDSNEQSANSLREFVVGLQDIEIKAGETAVVNVPLQIPENAAPGAYYGAVRFKGVPIGQAANEDAQLSLNASVAALVLVEVPGDLTEKIEVSSVSAYIDDDPGSLFVRRPNRAGIEIKNLGNGFSKPFGSIRINGPWGVGEVYSYELNDTNPRGNVLPDSSRLFKDDISGVKWPGRYTIAANISHGRGGEVLPVTGSFWYLPIWFLAVVAVVVLLLGGLSYRLFKKHRLRTLKRPRRR